MPPMLLSLGLSLATLAGQPTWPIVIGHRGASGYLPEHTLEAYALAIEQGADFIEPDVVATRDGALIARHENEISQTTDVAEKFPERKATKVIDGQAVTGWFTEDFTLAELKTLKAKQRLDFRDQSHNGTYPIPTLAEVMALVRRKSLARQRPIGIYVETKHPSYFASIQLPLEAPLTELLRQHGFGPATAFIQSFETANLKALKRMTDVPLILLLEDSGQPYDFTAAGDPRTYADLLTPSGLQEVATYAAGIGPYKRLIVPAGPDQKLLGPTSLVRDAHGAQLQVHPWTFRNEASYLAPDYQGDPAAEYRQFFALGIDGLFSDFPDAAVQARQRFFAAE